MQRIFHCSQFLRHSGQAILLALSAALLPAATEQPADAAGHLSALEYCKVELGGIRERFNLLDDRDLARLHEASAGWMKLVERRQFARTQMREELRAGAGLEGLSRAALDAYYAEPADLSTQRDRRGLEQLQRLSGLALNEKDAALKRRHVALLAEVVEALNHNRLPPIPPNIDILELPLVHYDYTHNGIATGEVPAWNLQTNRAIAEADLSQLNPLPSSFWTPRTNIGALNLLSGFGRAEVPRIEDEMLAYHEPKTGFGGHAGFEAKWESIEVKIKFGELHSEPFAARLFWALGYNTDAIDYAPQLKMKYDRRFFREFNQRREVSTRISALLVLPIYTLRFQPRHDPFEFIAVAVMKDGSRLSGRQLKAAIFRDAGRPDAEEDPGNFRPEVEQAIDHLITSPANVQIKDPKAKSIGPWTFGGLGHEGRRELRGAGLLAAWIGWTDSRFENTRLKIVETDSGPELKHYFTDLGGGLGRSTGLVYRQGELPNEFAWTFTQPSRFQGKGRMTIPFRITGYQPIEDTPAFEQMTIDDARWMARRIGQLTEDQIVAALIASGLGSAHVRLYTEKLICRRDRMICDLELNAEVPLLRPAGVSRRLSHNPGTDGLIRATLPDGRQTVSQDGPFVVEDGRLRSAQFKER
jgi:hypothetical protein